MTDFLENIHKTKTTFYVQKIQKFEFKKLASLLFGFVLLWLYRNS